MATWETESVFMLRQYINDVDPTNYTYDDVRLLQVIITAAKYVSHDVPLVRKEYVINPGEITITPDPVEDPEDTAFLILMTLKAGCLLDLASLREKARQEGVKAKLGPAEINITGQAGIYKDILNGKNSPCGMYEQAKREYMMGADIFPWRAVLTPYTSSNVPYNGRYAEQGDSMY
jgi:hypothetical protein